MNITADMFSAAYVADVSGPTDGRYARIITAVWPLIIEATPDPVTALDEACSAAGLDYEITLTTMTDCAWSAQIVIRPATGPDRPAWGAVEARAFVVAGCAQPGEVLDAACHAAAQALASRETPS